MSNNVTVTSQPSPQLKNNLAMAREMNPATIDNAMCERKWGTQICGCFENKRHCLLGTFLWPCMKCHMANRIGEFPGVGCLVPGGLLAMRVKIRTLLGIKGSICQDCAVVTFCEPCAVCQMSRELDKMGL
ncbi:placenta-specific gene 8 protein-like [Liolophura sinensis]|uniref:placenta-specific gene 8 protein-like n=1 Tax=Liolophura sinensis TaxID=3198878 RepID=UPI003158B053